MLCRACGLRGAILYHIGRFELVLVYRRRRNEDDAYAGQSIPGHSYEFAEVGGILLQWYVLTCWAVGQACVIGAEEYGEKPDCSLFGLGYEFGKCYEGLRSVVAGEASVDDVETSDEN